MEVLLSPPPPPPLPPELQTVTGASSAPEFEENSDPTVENYHPTLRAITKRKMKKKRRKIEGKDEEINDSSSIGFPSSASSSTRKGAGLTLKRRNHPRVRLGVGRHGRGGDLEAIALPLGMSFAAVVAQVLERQGATSERMSADYLSTICTSAIRESLANVFGDKFDFFVRNFEKSFGSTLRTLKLINESSVNKGNCLSDVHDVEVSNLGIGYSSSSEKKNSPSEINLPSTATNNRSNNCEEVEENVTSYSVERSIAIHGQANQLACVIPSTCSSSNQSIVSTFEKSFMEQVRSNDLKTLELSLTMEKLKLKEAQLALNVESNHLGRSKLAMGISKAVFNAEKFKNQVEDTRHAELQRNCVDCLVAGMFVMSFSLLYGAYVFSYERITEATETCFPSTEEAKSWWMPKPISSFNSGLSSLKCQVQVLSRMLFGVLVILTIAYLLLQRSVTTKQTMPITFILLLLGAACGLAGKFCVDTLGGSGYHWLFHWETLCLLHFFSNAWTSALFFILYGPVNVTPGMKCSTMLPYWIRRLTFYCIVLLLLPLLCGLMPFASMVEWKDHFGMLLYDLVMSSSD